MGGSFFIESCRVRWCGRTFLVAHSSILCQTQRHVPLFFAGKRAQG